MERETRESTTTSESQTPLNRNLTCLLSIVVSRPEQIASHRGVIQESFVCTARHPTFMWNSQVFDSSTGVRFQTQNPATHFKHSTRQQCKTTQTATAPPYTTNCLATQRQCVGVCVCVSVSQSVSDTLQTQIGAKDTQSNLHFRSEWTMRCLILIVWWTGRKRLHTKQTR